MKRLNSEDALFLLEKDIINCEDDYYKPQNRWIWHSIYTGEAAGRIASKLGLNEDRAKALGYVHDIGRKIDHERHVLEGYYYLQELGYIEDSGVCLTHSFVNNDVNLVAGGLIDEKRQLFFAQYFLEHSCSIYDNIVQMCDLFCLDTGFTTVEKRLLDIYKRKGVFSNTAAHLESAMFLKESLEGAMGCSLYSLFPEMSQNDLNKVEKDYSELLDMLDKTKKSEKMHK